MDVFPLKWAKSAYLTLNPGPLAPSSVHYCRFYKKAGKKNPRIAGTNILRRMLIEHFNAGSDKLQFFFGSFDLFDLRLALSGIFSHMLSLFFGNFLH
jgi:hypothetical protein